MLSKSLPSILIIIPIGVITIKKTNHITNVAIILPKIIPNLTQILLNGVKIFELNMPNIKNTNDNKIDHILISASLSNGHKPIITKTIKKRIPKLLLELILIFLLPCIIFIN